MRVLTKPKLAIPVISPETDLLMQNLIASLDLARTLGMTMQAQLLEMALIDLGRIVATLEKQARDRDPGLH